MEKKISGEFLWEENFNKMLKGKCIIKDEKYFNINFNSKILHREDELNELLLLFIDLVTNSFSKGINQFVIGESGIGKTATVKYFSNKLIECANQREVNLKYVHINCRKEQSWYRVLIKIIKTFSPTFPERGYSPQEILDNLTDYLISQKMHLLLVLDDLDYLLKIDNRFLYSIIQLNENHKESQDLISVIAILKDISLIKNILKEIIPFFQRNVINFKRYHRSQIFDILKDRAVNGLRSDCFSDELIQKISNKVFEIGDLKYGINLLWKVAKVAMSKSLNKISLECIDLADKEVSNTSFQTRLMYLTIPQLSFLLSIVKEIKNSGNREVTISEVLIRYENLCRRLGIKPKSVSQLRNFIQVFIKDDLVQSEIKSNSIRGRKAILNLLNFDLTLFEEKIINILNYRGIDFE